MLGKHSHDQLWFCPAPAPSPRLSSFPKEPCTPLRSLALRETHETNEDSQTLNIVHALAAVKHPVEASAPGQALESTDGAAELKEMSPRALRTAEAVGSWRCAEGPGEAAGRGGRRRRGAAGAAPHPRCSGTAVRETAGTPPRGARRPRRRRGLREPESGRQAKAQVSLHIG